jgi:hypothetical protein
MSAGALPMSPMPLCGFSLRQVYRRHVIKPLGAVCEYTDDPEEFPDLAGLAAEPPPKA